MKRLTLSMLLAVSVLVWTGTAQAKELTSFKVCGASGCKTVTARAVLRPLIRAVEAQGEPVSVPTPAPSSFVRLEFMIRGDTAAGPSFIQYYVPSRGLVAIQTNPGAWTWAQAGSLRSLFDSVIAGVTSFAAPSFARVTLGGKTVSDPASYSRLFTLQGKADSYPDEPDWKAISLETPTPTPWSTGAPTLEYSPTKHVLWRGSEFVKVPAALAKRLEARKSLAGSDGGSFPWLPLFGGLGGAALIIPTALLFRRRRAG